MKIGCTLSTGNLRKVPPKNLFIKCTMVRLTPIAEIIMNRRGALRMRRGL